MRIHFKYNKTSGTLTADTMGADVNVKTEKGDVLAVVWVDGRVTIYSDRKPTFETNVIPNGQFVTDVTL